MKAAQASGRSTGEAELLGEQPGDGVVVATLQDAVSEHAELVEPRLGSLVLDRDKFSAQNASSWSGGAFVYVPRGVRVEVPIVLSAIQASASSHFPWRSLIVVEPEAEVTVVEQYLSTENDLEAYFNPVTELFVGEGANVRLPLRAGPLGAKLDPG